MSATSYNDIVDQSDLILFCGLICCGDFFYLNKECCGCSGKCECCCIREAYCCKIGKCYPIGCCEAKDTLCSCGLGCYECSYIEPTTFMKYQSQFCCCVERCAIPNDDEVPMVCACCGLACYPGFGCYEKMSTLQGELPKAPVYQERPIAQVDEGEGLGTAQGRPKAPVYQERPKAQVDEGEGLGTAQGRPKVPVDQNQGLGNSQGLPQANVQKQIIEIHSSINVN